MALMLLYAQLMLVKLPCRCNPSQTGLSCKHSWSQLEADGPRRLRKALSSWSLLMSLEGQLTQKSYASI